MKNIKALIKVELRPAVLMGIYFLVIHMGGLLFAGISINQKFENYLRYGYGDYDVNGDIFLSLLSGLILFVFLGMLILIYFQFQYDKSIEVGRFLKALPYTNLQRCLVKVSAGLLSFSIPFILFTAGLMGLRSYAIVLFDDIYKVLPYEKIIGIINGAEHLIYFLVLNYGAYCAVYLFLFMMQYLMNNNIGSLVTGPLVLSAPLFVTLSAFEIYGVSYTFEVEKLFVPVYGIARSWQQLVLGGETQEQYLGYAYIEDIGLKFIITVLMIGLCSIIIYFTAQKSKIEDADVLIPHRVNRWIFIVGVSICSGFLLADMGQLLILPLIMNNVFMM